MPAVKQPATRIGKQLQTDAVAASRRWRLSARVPAYGAAAWLGSGRHPESADDFGSVASLQHIARTLALGRFDLALIEPARRTDANGAFDPWLGAMVMALAAPGLRVGLRRAPVRRTWAPDPALLLGEQWAGLLPPDQAVLSVRVLVAANRWMAEDQLEYALRHYPLTPCQARRAEVDIPTVVGTPQEVVENLEDLVARHCSTSNPTAWAIGPAALPPMLELVPIHIPGSYEAFVRMVVPQLRRQGLIGEHGAPWRPTT